MNSIPGSASEKAPAWQKLVAWLRASRTLIKDLQTGLLLMTAVPAATALTPAVPSS